MTTVYECRKPSEFNVERVEAPIPVQTVPAPVGSAWQERLGAAPWWLVSLSLHVLMIALAGLVSMAIELPRNDDAVTMITELQQFAAPVQEQEKPKSAESALASALETPPTDPTSKDASDVVVPPDILARAELGDHFETVNPDLPDTHSALGNADSKSFHSVAGNTEPPGGGGTGGMGMEDVIGVGGAGSRGSGGGFGGGDGTGVGVGSGAGKGSFGNRTGSGRKFMVKRHGGSPATENAVGKALEWLAYHQEADGHWDAGKYGADGDGNPGQACDMGATGLALLAFLGAGHTEKIGAYKDNVRRAIEWIIKQQDKDGLLKSAFRGNGYCHAVAGLALAEAGAMGRNPKVLEAAQKAVNNSTDIRQHGAGSDRLGWRYYGGHADECDTSVTGWYIMQMKSCKIAGLHVDPLGVQGAENWLNSVEVDKPKADDPYTGGTFGYTDNRFTYASVTSVGMLGRLFLGAKPETLGSGVALLMKNLPEWSEDNGTYAQDKKFGQLGNPHAMYYWYYGTLAMFQIGGDEWKTWNKAMKKALLEHQCNAGDDTGSWPPFAREGPRGGRVVCTAFGALTLEVYYRYAQLNGGR